MEKPNPQILISAYMQGIFPMAHPDEDDSIYWYAPDPRGIIPIDGFHCPSRLAQTVSQEPFEIRYDTAFQQVMHECAAPRKIQKTTWISEGLIEAYSELNDLGFAHSVEAWVDDELVGGLYGVSVGGMFAGESMFYRKTDASKVCLVHLVERLKERGFTLLDVQFVNDHLEQFGATEISREEYESRLADALEQQVQFT